MANKRLHSRRTVFDFAKPALAKYSALVGEVTWAHNNLHSTLFVIFQLFLPEGRVGVQIATELWHSLRSDDMQRAALRAVIRYTLELNEDQRAKMLWVIESAGRLSSFRNDAIHTAFELSSGKKGYFFEPGRAAHPKKMERLNRVGHARLFRLLIGDLNQLADYAYAITEKGKLRFRGPRRPILKSVSLVEQSPPRKS